MKKILLQTTIQHARDDWSIERFSILANLLSKIEDETGTRLFGKTPGISWPNYHSGSNGDFQRVDVIPPLHPIMQNPLNSSGHIELLPAHPHEGAISVPPAEKQHARVIATGTSLTTGTHFNIAISFERNGGGRAVVDSSFHHFLDYNLAPLMECSSFLTHT